MDPKQIKALIEMIQRSDFSTFELEKDGFKLKLVRGATAATPAAIPAVETLPVAAPPAAAASVAGEATVETAPSAPSETDGLVEMPSPIIGTFFIAPGPDSPPFVEVGSKINKGQVICIVEAMKVMNEIEVEIDGEVAEILVANGQPVEYGEVLFRLRPR